MRPTPQPPELVEDISAGSSIVGQPGKYKGVVSAAKLLDEPEWARELAPGCEVLDEACKGNRGLCIN